MIKNTYCTGSTGVEAAEAANWSHELTLLVKRLLKVGMWPLFYFFFWTNWSQMMKSEFGDIDYSLSRGIETGGDATEFILLGANSIQVGPQSGFCFQVKVNCHVIISHL